ncbi:MAG TPA: HepT-like ribonuclease domain-containing protein [Pyrinomonadaceae bacterium]|jgi:uncharacterized protein with HEPN domain|nr:HepT-like ribonuclease domain-containing protein [Pyrinomonadaceae bacterium]
MQRDPKVYLFDIIENADKILDFVVGLDLPSYRSNDLVKSAVERRFINIGEALTKLKSADLGTFGAIGDANRIVAFRNVLVHGYESISDELV